MATNFNNKYLQVLQNYDEFGEYSADYTKGEDHVAFLIEENEVIYWLYLEQVLRPLNVRTTKTGELEDGRIKVAVKLEYVEGGQKYTSVPNIPDPERITSMSHFLEDYPDIEEVNVSGTVNLTDLSYAFAGSKIKDFNMLDTSNVTNIEGIIDNINNKDLDITIKYKTHYNEEQNSVFNNITLNKLELIQLLVFDYYIEIHDSNINKLILNNQRIVLYGTNGSSIINEIESDDYVSVSSANGNSKGNKISNIVANEININLSGLVDDNILNIKFNKLIINDSNFNSYNWKNKIVCLSNDNICNIVFAFDYTRIYNFSFGYGIDYSLLPNANLAVRDDCIIGNFIFTVPIVNDDFYNKYSNANKISIFQYKTVFEEIADVNISSEVDSNLIYVNLDSIDFDASNMNIEIYNIINFENNNKSIAFNKFILDNRELDLTYDTYPKDCSEIDNIFANEGYISGNYVCYLNWTNYGSADNDTKLTINTNTLLKNIILWDYSEIYVYGSILTDNNIKFAYSKAPNMPIIYCYTNNVDISNLKDENNIVTCALNTNNDDYKLLYKEDIILNIIKGYYSFYLKLILDYVKQENSHIINNGIILIHWNNYLMSLEQITKIENIYLHGNVTLSGFYSLCNSKGDFEDYEISFKNSISNIYGENITITLPGITGTNSNRILNVYPDKDVYKHIDIYKSKANSKSYITIFMNLDEESTINLITKLVDNTSSDIKTIYMYRSQANIIGEENIAAAVAKNYEIAIIEN